MFIKSSNVKGRRQIKFESLDQIWDEATRLAAGETQSLGNWSLGQVCQHLANAMDMSIDGTTTRPPLLIRWIGPLFKRRVLAGPMSAGFQLPAPAAAFLVPGETSIEKGLAELKRGLERLHRESIRKPHPVFGRLTRGQWDQLHLRHSEMHLSFIVPKQLTPPRSAGTTPASASSRLRPALYGKWGDSRH